MQETPKKIPVRIEVWMSVIHEMCIRDSPKVIYNEKTQQYVMWAHWEMPADYKLARCAVAVCDTIDGDYTCLLYTSIWLKIMSS